MWILFYDSYGNFHVYNVILSLLPLQWNNLFFIELQFQFFICRKNLIHRVCSIAMYLSDQKESACNAGDPGSVPWSGRSPGGGNWQPTPVFLPGQYHGQRSQAGYSLWVHKESDTTEQLTFLLFWLLNFSCERHRDHYCGILPKILSYNMNKMQLEL